MRRPIMLLIASAMALAACGQPKQQTQAALVESRDAPPTESSSKVLTFSAQKVEGGQFDATDLEGKDVALWFYAPW